MNPLYNIGIKLYRGAAGIAGKSSPKVREMLRGQAETFQRLESFRAKMAPEGFDVWFHAASLGEFEQARPLIERLLSSKPDFKILLSFFSPSGYTVRQNFNPSVAVVYLPFDLPQNAARFVELAAPKMAIFVKYEFWGNYLNELARRNVPTYIISAIFRPGQIFFKPWGGAFRNILRNFSHLYVQDERSKQLLASIGIDKVSVTGDTRFDRVTDILKAAREVPLAAALSSRAGKGKLLVVGSSWERDEDVYIPWLRQHPEVCAIVAPHEFDKKRLEDLRSRLGADRTALLSELSGDTLPPAVRYIIVDCFGLLSSLYRYADVAYIGGGFGTGIHNINEAAVYGAPVVFGPRHQKFNEAAGLIDCGGGFSVNSENSLANIFNTLFSQPDARQKAGRNAGEYISSHIGATPRILSDLFNI